MGWDAISPSLAALLALIATTCHVIRKVVTAPNVMLSHVLSELGCNGHNGIGMDTFFRWSPPEPDGEPDLACKTGHPAVGSAGTPYIRCIWRWWMGMCIVYGMYLGRCIHLLTKKYLPYLILYDVAIPLLHR